MQVFKMLLIGLNIYPCLFLKEEVSSHIILAFMFILLIIFVHDTISMTNRENPMRVVVLVQSFSYSLGLLFSFIIIFVQHISCINIYKKKIVQCCNLSRKLKMILVVRTIHPSHIGLKSLIISAPPNYTIIL